MKRLVFFCFSLVHFSWGQVNLLAPYELTITSETVFASTQEELDQMRLGFEAQQWPVEILKYTLYRMRQNPYIVSGFSIKLTLVHPDQSKKIVIDVPVNTDYVKAFRTEEGFNERYVNFLSDTYEWILDYR